VDFYSYPFSPKNRTKVTKGWLGGAFSMHRVGENCVQIIS
jgi:hypothetical protein